jgi:hypothetical protein
MAGLRDGQILNKYFIVCPDSGSTALNINPMYIKLSVNWSSSKDFYFVDWTPSTDYKQTP